MEKRSLRLFNVKKINVAAVALFFLFFIGGLLVLLFGTKAPNFVTGKAYFDMLAAVGVVVVGVAVHEGLHALSAMLLGKAKKEDISFGFSLKQGAFFCHVKKPVTLVSYRLMLILPVILTGVIPFVICLFFGGIPFVAAFALLIAGGVGDVVMLFGTRKENKNVTILDSEKTTAYYACYKGGEEPKGFVETTEEDEKKMFESVEKQGAESVGVKIVLIAIFIALFVLVTYLVALLMKLL